MARASAIANITRLLSLLPACGCAWRGQLRKTGYKSREKVVADIQAGALHPENSGLPPDAERQEGPAG